MLAFVVPVAAFWQIPTAHALLDDRAVTIATTVAFQAKRAELIRFIWGEAGFPANSLAVFIKNNDRSPVPKLVNLKRVDTLRIRMESGLQGMAHHFIPKRNVKNRLVVLHLGHSRTCSFNDGTPDEPDAGMRRTLNRLLKEGFPVLAVYMPQVTPEDCRWEHNALFQRPVVSGSPMKFFLEPTAVSLNYVMKTYPNYRDIVMIGLSGGGWTTTVYAAIDPRVRISIPVAGTVPLVMRREEDGHDMEQVLEDFYKIAGYPDLYLLGSLGAHRRQVQVLNRRDDCCFGEQQHNARKVGMSYDPALRDCEKRVQAAVKGLGNGSYTLYIDEAADRHMISDDVIEKVIIPELRKQ